MNPHYSQQQPYYNYQQHVPGPPQPQWQNPQPQPPPAPQPQSPGGWHDPRFQNIPPPPPPPPPLPQSPAYGADNFAPNPSHHSTYPPGVSGTPQPQENFHRPAASQYDTSQWGVKYNQPQYSQFHPEQQQTLLQPEQKPTLPPRPGSALSYTVQQQQQYTPQSSAPSSIYAPVAPQYQPQGLWNIPHGPAQEPKPPTPPPRPAAYGSGVQYGTGSIPQEHYAYQPPTHRYDPQPPMQTSWQMPQHHQNPSVTTGWNQTQHHTDGPVSPLEDERRRFSLTGQSHSHYIDHEPPSQNVQLPPNHISQPAIAVPDNKPSSTAFGAFSGPSDWQHYDPSDPHAVSDDEKDHPIIDSHAGQFTASPPPTQVAIKRRSTERIRPSSKPSSYPSTQTQEHGSAESNVQFYSHDQPASMAVSATSSQVPNRQDSRQSTVSAVSGLGRDDSIDNVIQAWSAPLKTDQAIPAPVLSTRTASYQDNVPVISKVETIDHGVQTDFKPQIETRVETRVETREVEVDPYADVQNEYKATLKRFADMLRQEASAGSDEEKFKIFQGFVIRELRLRSVLYGVEAQPSEVSASKQQSHNSGQVSSLPPSIQSNVPESPKHERLPPLQTARPATPTSRDESFVVVNADEDSEYSPGGRPRISPLKLKTSKLTEKPSDTSGAHRSVTSMSNEPGPVSPSMNAPMTLDDYVMPDQPSPSANAPIVVGSDDIFEANQDVSLAGPLNFQPARPLYQPFRYGSGDTSQIPAVEVHGPPPESFAALRQNQAAESGRTLVYDAAPADTPTAPNRGHTKTPSGGRREHEEAFIGLIRAKSMAIRKNANASPRPDSPAILRAGTPANRSTPSPAPVPPLVKSVQALRALMPRSPPHQPGPKSPPHPKLESLVSALHKLPDDFGFIHARVLAWDKTNRQTRAKQDSERQARQSQNEEHIDHLFNDNEIGYADIAELEKDFKLEEAGRKYKEDQQEVESFTKTVFEFVAGKINDEVKDLTRLQTNAIDLLDLESISGAKQIQKLASQSMAESNHPTSAPASAIMELILEIHEKLELRHMKIAEANFERERRKKRLEQSVLYTNNDKPGMKKLEGEFAKAEKLQVLEESRRKAERANRLLDGFDRAVVRGLGENQAFVDDAYAKLQLLRDLVMGSEENGPPGQAREDLLYGPDGVRALMDQASATIDYIHSDSKSLVQMLDKADTLSNDADFDLYISEAKLADESSEKFAKLKSEKVAEDRNVAQELTNRMNGISRVPGEIMGLVREIKDKIGVDVGHEERIGRALEAAKRRNTSIGSP